MKTIIICLSALMSSVAFADKTVAPKYYVDGQFVSAEAAIMAIAKGGHAMKCQDVEMKATKTGVSLKAAKAQ